MPKASKIHQEAKSHQKTKRHQKLKATRSQKPQETKSNQKPKTTRSQKPPEAKSQKPPKAKPEAKSKKKTSKKWPSQFRRMFVQETISIHEQDIGQYRCNVKQFKTPCFCNTRKSNHSERMAKGGPFKFGRPSHFTNCQMILCWTLLVGHTLGLKENFQQNLHAMDRNDS